MYRINCGGTRYHGLCRQCGGQPYARTSANRGYDYFWLFYFYGLYDLYQDHLRLYHDYSDYFLQNFNNDYTRLLHYLQKDDYFTYCTTIISLIVFGIYYCDYCNYITIICFMFISSYYFYYFIWDVLLRLFFPKQIICIMRIILLLFELVFCLTIITIIFFQYYYMPYCFSNTISSLGQLWR